MNKDYRNEDFFISEDGKDLFEMQSSEDIPHICVTDEAEEIEKVVVSGSSKKSKETIKIVVGLGDHIPLWKQNVTLQWRFNHLFDSYSNSENVKNYIRGIVDEAIEKWGDASPVKFTETTSNAWDFEIMMRPDNCNAYGCTLASAFFPNSTRNLLTLYPKMFTQNRFEQVETLIHEFGHIFGLRHFFAKENEGSWRSEIFGDHYPLTIMNYGHNSTLTEQDRSDLKRLYSLAWSNQLNDINGLPVRLFHPGTFSLK